MFLEPGAKERNGSERRGSAQRQLDREGLNGQRVNADGCDTGILDSRLAP